MTALLGTCNARHAACSGRGEQACAHPLEDRAASESCRKALGEDLLVVDSRHVSYSPVGMVSSLFSSTRPVPFSGPVGSGSRCTPAGSEAFLRSNSPPRSPLL
ncbi:conserved hypothetical protein [Citreicella sp. SE45]|nr:conserved hypothetical protein [Citreicella sp. SE45]